MNSSAQVTTASGADEVKAAAAIWARAKACRDEDPAPASVEETTPGILRRLAIDGAELFLARLDGRPVGFALVAPRPRTLELSTSLSTPTRGAAAWGATCSSVRRTTRGRSAARRSSCG
ncbi:GNAT family N-acetyltransferase [Lentzea tibetensis]|uniref:GNAT family N-acetyltransferase n=1 Tax=Lentzea tibetensis TaxID=2591470 RepID=UPI0016484032|nr:GNAT family N-acetyltransferase [Lentzea tibetensis]